jgi:hypothetical protein
VADQERVAGVVVGQHPALQAQLQRLARARIVFLAGLPGTGKSLLVHQLAHLATAGGRTVHLLQWDVARPAFEASPAGARYPLVEGVTHALIRKAAGLWARQALVAWEAGHPDPRHMVIGETPFVGGRFVELARPADDGAEAVLTSPSCRFAIAVPSREVRRFLEAERERRSAGPLHPREREDAPPRVLRDLWRELAAVARRLGVESSDEYDPAAYRRVYERVLRHRNADVVPLDVILPTRALSVYDFAVDLPDLVPTAGETRAFIEEAERRHPDASALQREIEGWWKG